MNRSRFDQEPRRWSSGESVYHENQWDLDVGDGNVWVCTAELASEGQSSSFTPTAARSLAAALLDAADVAEGVKP